MQGSVARLGLKKRRFRVSSTGRMWYTYTSNTNALHVYEQTRMRYTCTSNTDAVYVYEQHGYGIRVREHECGIRVRATRMRYTCTSNTNAVYVYEQHECVIRVRATRMRFSANCPCTHEFVRRRVIDARPSKCCADKINAKSSNFHNQSFVNVLLLC